MPPLKTQASEVLVECDSLGPGNLGPGQAGNLSLYTALPVFLLLAIVLCEADKHRVMVDPPPEGLAQAARVGFCSPSLCISSLFSFQFYN